MTIAIHTLRRLMRTTICAIGVFTLTHTGTVSAAQDPTATNFDYTQCQGSYMPYPQPSATIATPDSLTPVLINHVGRHGARYYSSPRDVEALREALSHAQSIGTTTPLGKKLMALTDIIMAKSKGRWGALDSLGMAEQRGIAARMVRTYPALFKDGQIKAISSRIPRCVNSMYSFLYQVTRLNNSVNITASSGPKESWLMRPFETDEAYVSWADEKPWVQTVENFTNVTAPLTPLIKVLGKSYPMNPSEARKLVMSMYKVLAGLESMMLPTDVSEYLTRDEYNRLWACNNLRQYLIRTTSTLSTLPSEISTPLIKDIIETTDHAIEADKSAGKNPQASADNPTVILRFGHAETLMPLLSQMRIPGCYYMTNYFDTVGKHWQNFHVVPMASNLQIILFKHKRGTYYVRFQLNEVPLSLNPDDSDEIYMPWDAARERLQRCIPFYEL